jgi:[acyl-carrier-protein] S-malonyltransferase
MAAILGLDDEKVVELCQKRVQGEGSVEAANYNAQGQVVIAGIQLVEAVMAGKRAICKAIALPVSVPSHCSLMKPAAEQFAEALEQTAIELPPFL